MQSREELPRLRRAKREHGSCACNRFTTAAENWGYSFILLAQSSHFKCVCFPLTDALSRGIVPSTTHVRFRQKLEKLPRSYGCRRERAAHAIEYGIVSRRHSRRPWQDVPRSRKRL